MNLRGLRAISTAGGRIYLVTPAGNISALTLAEYALLSGPELCHTHVFLLESSAVKCAAAIVRAGN